MTARRQEDKGSSWKIGPLAAVALCCAALAFVYPMNLVAQAALSERVVADRYTGLAIGGFDAVAYFTDGTAVAGSTDIEAAVEGAVWQFQNESNRAFFLTNPEVYSPRFGGYDPVGVARGVAAAGSPHIWLVSRERLYLFNREENRDLFLANASKFIEEANDRWPTVKGKLADY